MVNFHEVICTMLKKLRKIGRRQNLFIILLFIIILLCYLFYPWKVNPTNKVLYNVNRQIWAPTVNCSARQFNEKFSVDQWSKISGNSMTRSKALVFLKDGKSPLSKDITYSLEAARLKFHLQYGDIKNLPVLTDDSKGRYAVVIFEDVFTYLSLHRWNRDVLDKYCREYDVGILYFLNPSKQDINGVNSNIIFSELHGFPLRYYAGAFLKNYHLNDTAQILRIARPGRVWTDELPSPYEWTVFETAHPTFHPVSYAYIAQEASKLSAKYRKRTRRKSNRGIFMLNSSEGDNDIQEEMREDEQERYPVVVHDNGMLDNIQRVIVGGNLNFCLHKVLFLDAVTYLSRGKLATPLERYVQIDIDDVFVGAVGRRMTADDVEALVEFQEQIRRNLIPNFSFRLGFSGKFIFRGNDAENVGDRRFLARHDNFSWFPHMWSHMQAHWFDNVTELCDYMGINRRFAQRHHFDTSIRYAVSPHHAGVFPVHEQLFDCWRSVWNISVTSTEEYPHLRPDHKRRGFVYRDVMVLPRQTCGLYTHTMELAKYPGGAHVLHELINGGGIFQSILYNQFCIFMTHLSNYGNDRLAIYTFERAFNFVTCWTNLRLVHDDPLAIAHKYFDTYPDERDPLWLNPCLDKRHAEIWSKQKSCKRLPDFVIVGPQKTGTTALHWFLKMHPDVTSNLPSPTTFEEVQFFGGANYYKGIDWYMDFFPPPSNGTVLFEKSATYFDQAVAPKRMKALLPRAAVVVVLIDPVLRAYSWYQHMRAHDEPTASAHTFYETIRSRRRASPPQLISLQRRCLDPGFYADHLENWLEYFPARQIIVVDGELLTKNPAAAMHQVQKSIGFKNVVDYDQILRFDERKGFFCQVTEDGKTNCLGKSKGRKYPDMNDKCRLFLDKYYADSNKRLLRLLKDMNKSIPGWLARKSAAK